MYSAVFFCLFFHSAKLSATAPLFFTHSVFFACVVFVFCCSLVVLVVRRSNEKKKGGITFEERANDALRGR